MSGNLTKSIQKLSAHGKTHGLTPRGWQMLQQNYYLQAALIFTLHLRPRLCWLSQLSKSKLHRTRVTQLSTPCNSFRAAAAKGTRNEQGKSGSSTLGQFLPIYLLGARQGCGTQLWSLGALHPARADHRGMLRGPHWLLYPPFWSAR